ncbi:YbaY family lipoprotein [Luteimonas huabeiensis]|uniref:YbaY family lipoprotein n=1 Tax=Luteimonas huabeiensis TaxID=1244513 RepID=UPI0004637888|nr:YbaY family lipoprotein [Luteimonas huabeiensis]
MGAGWMAACLAAMALTGCHGVPAAPEPAPSGAVVEGSATFYEKLMMPAGSVLTVELVDLDGGQAYARSEFPSLPGPPYAFALRYDPGRVPPGRRLGVHASLRTPEGERMFATAAPVPVEAGRAGTAPFRMLRTP